MFQEDFVNSIKQYLATKPAGSKYEDDTLNILAVSGEGSNSAFTARLINGWAASGKRVTASSDWLIIASTLIMAVEACRVITKR